jgi:2-iminobutanoate/2-iminopropanoate deaminase
MKKVISTTDAPAAIGPYSQALEANGTIFLSGMLPIDPATGEFAPGGAKEQTEQIFINIKALLAAAGLTMDKVVKTTVFLDDMSYFAEMNEVYAAYFNAPFPARSTVAVQTLPKNALVEIEVIAMR